MEPSVEQTASLVAGSTPVQIITLLCLGSIAVVGLVWLVNWIINARFSGVPDLLRSNNKELVELGKAVAEMKAKFWTHEEIKEEIENAINRHLLKCGLNPNSKDARM